MQPMTPVVPRIGIVVPVYGNQESLRPLYERLKEAVQGLEAQVVFQFVNDCSPDHSQEVLEDLAREDSRVRVAVLSKNHGSFVAIVAGLSLLRNCDAAAFISADLQDPPEIIPQMIAAWKAGRKVVLCARRRREDPPLSRMFSALYYKIYRWLVMPGMPEAGFDFALLDRQVI
jgi:polyisoprenyl-phosphate glycosyltransferase